MKRVYLVFSKEFSDELADRPGRSKLEKERAAIPRMAMERIALRAQSDLYHKPGTSHLRADLLEEPVSTRQLYRPASLSALLMSVDRVVRIPPASRFHRLSPAGYLAQFTFPRVGWSVLAGYDEPREKPVLVFLDTHVTAGMAMQTEAAARSPVEFDRAYAIAQAIARRVP